MASNDDDPKTPQDTPQDDAEDSASDAEDSASSDPAVPPESPAILLDKGTEPPSRTVEDAEDTGQPEPEPVAEPTDSLKGDDTARHATPVSDEVEAAAPSSNDHPFARDSRPPMDLTSFLPAAITLLLIFFGCWTCLTNRGEEMVADSPDTSDATASVDGPESAPEAASEDPAAAPDSAPDASSAKPGEEAATASTPPVAEAVADNPTDLAPGADPSAAPPAAPESVALPPSPDGGQRGSAAAEEALESSRGAESRGDFRGALVAADAGVAAAPGLARYEVQRARVLLGQGRLQDALNQIDAAVGHEPLLADSYELRAQVLDGLGDARAAGYNRRAAAGIRGGSLLAKPPGRN